MRILIATDFYKNNLGGVTSSVFALRAGLRNYGHQVKVLAMSKNTKSYHKDDDYLLGSVPAYYAPDMRFSFLINDPMIKELIERPCDEAPKFWLNPEIKNFYDFTPDDVRLDDYETGPQIKDIPIAV